MKRLTFLQLPVYLFPGYLSQSLLNRDSKTFWKNFKDINSANVSPSANINGSVIDSDIVISFSNCYSSVYVDSEDGILFGMHCLKN